MPIALTDTLVSLTNVQCALLRDELAALIVAEGIATPTVRDVRRRLRLGNYLLADQIDENAERAAIARADAQRALDRQALDTIRQRREARRLDAASDAA